MPTQTTIETFLRFFTERGHEPITGSTLLPPNIDDPVLFVTSGVHPLNPYLQGREHPQGRRLVNCQRCLRTTDLDEVGDDTHLTVFEMLGSWSLGDYGHNQSLRWGYELLTGGLGVDPSRLHVTVFGGDERCGPDTESERTCSQLGLPVTRLVSENWWVGPGGMCGPDSEMFVWTGPGDPEGDPSTDPRWVEVWNHVSMRYQDTGGDLLELPRRCVDTGMGLERLLMVLQGKDSIYGTDLFEPWMTLVGSWGLDGRSRRLVVDHLRSLVVLSGDGVRPSNTGRGYVPRRLLRRGLTELWNTRPDLGVPDVPDEVIGSTLGHFGSRLGVTDVRDVLEGEQRRYRSLLERGRRVVQRHLRGRRPTREDYRYLHDTQGLPRDVVDRLVPR